MKKLLLLIVFILCLCFQANAMNPAFLNMVCGPSSACTSCTPGDPADVYCEDAENTGGSAWCSWTTELSSGNTITYVSHNGTLACTDRGSYAIQFDIDGDNGELCNMYWDAGAGNGSNAIYNHFYFNLKTWSADSGTQVVFALIQSFDRGSNHAYLELWNNSGTIYIRMLVTTQSGLDTVQGPSITAGTTWHNIKLEWHRNTLNGANLNVDGTDYALASGHTTIDSVARVYNLGSHSTSGGIDAGETISYQIDIVETDETAMSGDCPE